MQFADLDIIPYEDGIDLRHPLPSHFILWIRSRGCVVQRAIHLCNLIHNQNIHFDILLTHRVGCEATVFSFAANAIHCSPTACIAPLDPANPGLELPYLFENFNIAEYDEFIHFTSICKIDSTNKGSEVVRHLNLQHQTQIKTSRDILANIKLKIKEISNQNYLQNYQFDRMYDYISKRGGFDFIITKSMLAKAGFNISSIFVDSATWLKTKPLKHDKTVYLNWI